MRYENHTASGKIVSVEFSTEGKEPFAFIRLRGHEHREDVVAWLSEPSLRQQVVSETNTNDGALLVIKSPQPPQQLLTILARHGEKLALPTAPPNHSIPGRGAA